MSSIASVTVLPKSALAAVREAATPKKSIFGKAKDVFWDLLARQGTSVGSYDWSGHILATLLSYLEERHGVKLMHSELDELGQFLSEKRSATCLILTKEHQKWLPDLDPSRFSESDLAKYYGEFNETDGRDSGRPMLDGIRFLRDAIAALDATTVGMLVIG